MTRRQRVVGAALIVLSSLLLGATSAGPGVSPAAAADDGLFVSADGSHWVPKLKTQLFAHFGMLVPGNGQHADLWIKNSSSYDASMRIAIKDLEIPSAAFASGVILTTTGQGTDLDQVWNVGDLDKCKVVIPTAKMKPGQIVKLGLTFTMLDLDGLTAQQETANVNFQVKMREVQGGVFPEDPCDETIISPASEGGGLPFTGQGIRTDLIIAAAVLVGIGLFLVVRRRRRADEEAEDATLVP